MCYFYYPSTLCPDKYIICFRILFCYTEYHVETLLFNCFVFPVNGMHCPQQRNFHNSLTVNDGCLPGGEQGPWI